MSDHHQKVHPVSSSPPQPARVPLIPSNSVRSDSGRDHFPPPPSPKQPTKQRCSCTWRVFCVLCLIFFLIVVALAATVGILFLVFHPKIPNYSIGRSLKVTRFKPNANNSITASFVVNVTAVNPNKHIGILYLDGSHLSAFYNNTLVCEGALPVFYQGHRNTTFINVPLNGLVNNATQMVAMLTQELSHQGGKIPLVLTAEVPIKAKLGKLKLMKMRFKVHCDLSIDNLSLNKKIRIRSSHCKIKFRRLF